jgi:hypothetical protein
MGVGPFGFDQSELDEMLPDHFEQTMVHRAQGILMQAHFCLWHAEYRPGRAPSIARVQILAPSALLLGLSLLRDQSLPRLARENFLVGIVEDVAIREVLNIDAVTREYGAVRADNHMTFQAVLLVPAHPGQIGSNDLLHDTISIVDCDPAITVIKPSLRDSLQGLRELLVSQPNG